MKLLLKYGADPNIRTAKVPERYEEGGPDPDAPDKSGLPPVPWGGPAVAPIHAASGVGYGLGFAGNTHRHAPEGWMPAVKFLVEELGADVNARRSQRLYAAPSRGRARRQRNDPLPRLQGRRSEGRGTHRTVDSGSRQRAGAAHPALSRRRSRCSRAGCGEPSPLRQLLAARRAGRLGAEREQEAVPVVAVAQTCSGFNASRPVGPIDAQVVQLRRGAACEIVVHRDVEARLRVPSASPWPAPTARVEPQQAEHVGDDGPGNCVAQLAGDSGRSGCSRTRPTATSCSSSMSISRPAPTHSRVARSLR